jgi:SAM-dependent methyltransferase
MPCTGLWWWLVLGLSTQPHYSSLLEYLQNSPSSAKLLDLGSCLGQDLRKLAHDGAPVKCLYGSDLIPEWETVGHALFRDQESFKGRYITAGIFDDPPDSLLVRTEGTWDVINILMFLHAFGWKDQVRACKKILKLLSSKPGSMIIGGQTGSVKAGEEMLKAPFLKEGFEKPIFRQSKETLKRMWEKVAESEGVKLKIWAEYRPRYELGEVDEEKRVQNENFFHKQIKSVGRRMFPPIERLE